MALDSRVIAGALAHGLSPAAIAMGRKAEPSWWRLAYRLRKLRKPSSR